jgi:hypothetical protein
LKWFLFILQIILAIFLAFFCYKQMNQNYLDTWFIIFTVFFFNLFKYFGMLNVITIIKRRIYAEKFIVR